MTLTLTSTTTLHGTVEMPRFGFGVFKIPDGKVVEDSVLHALKAGYRLVDTAAIYRNEVGVGNALQASGLPREEIFLTTKVWNTEHGYDKTMAAFDESLSKLQTAYVDLYLIHWPGMGPDYSQQHDTWRAMEALHREGRARAIGVSNFYVKHLKELLEVAEVVPSVNQIEFHPHLQQPETVAFCREHGIEVQAWSPLKRGEAANMPELAEIGDRYGKNAVQVTLRWMLQRGILTIPKSVTPARIEANADLFDFELSEEELALVDGMDRGERTGPHPDTFF